MMQRMGVRAPILLVGGVIITFMLDPFLALILFLTLPFIAYLVYYRSKKGIPLYAKVQEAIDKMTGVVRENAWGVRVIKALSKVTYERKRYALVNEALSLQEKKASKTMAIINPLMNFFMYVGLTLVIIIGAYLVTEGLSTTGKIIAFSNYFTIISNATMSIGRIFIMASKGIASSDRIEAILKTHDEFEVIDDKEIKSSAIIEFDDVSFSYLSKSDDLKNISFKLDLGKTLGIIGPTGSGKSTILELLLRFYEARSGHIYILGRDIRSYSLKELRSHFGVALQNDFLFEGTIKDNVDFKRHLPLEDIEKGLKIAKADFVKERPSQLENKLNSKGSNLSGGQRQRLYIARAVSSKADVIILDDASSALDYKTDALLREMIDKYLSLKTKIIISQRISSLKHADEILVLDKGEIIARGKHEELLKSCPLYDAIAKSQMGGALFE